MRRSDGSQNRTPPRDGTERMKIVSVINYKGGVGKTALTANLAAELAWHDKRVLMLDLDPQTSLTFSFILPDIWERDFSGAGQP